MKLRTIHSAPPFAELAVLAQTAPHNEPELRDTVARIISEVASRGDAALLEYTSRFDGLHVASAADLRLPADALAEAAAGLDSALLDALRRAADNIRRFHERQRESGFLDLLPDGSVLGQRVAPLRRVGIYVPGGRAAYPSSVLMNALPASVAGVEEIAMVTPAREGQVEQVVLAAAHVAGVTVVVRVGGAQAVAALAYGTETVPGGGQDRGPRQPLGGGSQAAGLWPRRHRHGRRAVGNLDHRR